MASLGELIERLQPGKHFIGLWVVRIRRAKGVYLTKWCVSYIDRENVHAETDLYIDPKVALEVAAKELGL